MANNGGNKRGLEQDGDDEAPDAKRIRNNDGNVILIQISPDEELEPIPKPGQLNPPRPIKALPKKRRRGPIQPCRTKGNPYFMFLARHHLSTNSNNLPDSHIATNGTTFAQLRISSVALIDKSSSWSR
jgi:hypothetical protein